MDAGGSVLIRFFIVEDEKLIREGISSYFDWESLGAAVVGTAEDGIVGLQGILESRAEAVITDVVMPHMDGLEMVRKLREKDWDGEVIFLSVYRDVEYLKSALRFSAVDFVFKPIENEELLATIRRVIARIRQKKKDAERLREERKASQSVMWLRLLQGIPTERLPAMSGGGFCVVLLAMEGESRSILRDIPEAVWQQYEGDQELILVLALPALSPEARSAEIVCRMQGMEKVRKVVSGCIVREPQRLSESLHSAKDAMAMLGVNKEGEHGFYVQEEWVQRFSHAIIRGDATWIDLVRQWWETVSGVAGSFHEIKSIVGIFCSALGEHVTTKEIRDAVWKAVFTASKSISASRSAAEMPELVEGYIKDLLGIVRSKTTHTEMARKLETVVRENLRMVHINMLAEGMHLSRSNLIRLMKKIHGKTVNDYITEIRIRVACELLMKTNMRVYEIAASVGYGDLKYFSEKFRFHVGRSPSEFRRIS
jgi:two-component system, response regulator YesN